jgi:hypothetical protein
MIRNSILKTNKIILIRLIKEEKKIYILST